jgi:C-methyltransferase-like protein/putative zinc binding protein/methyltransferase family protein
VHKSFSDADRVMPHRRCRVCSEVDLHGLIDLGRMPLANAFVRKDQLCVPEEEFPLRVGICPNCHLIQLLDVVNPIILFRHYIYRTSKVPVMPDHFRNYANQVWQRFRLSASQFVIEIGSNDGVLLGEMQKLGPRVIGIDPAVNVGAIANRQGVPTLLDLFSADLAMTLAQKYGHAKVVIANNVVAHIDDLFDLMKGVDALLMAEGIFIFEVPHISDMLENLSFDSIYHEHLSYFSLGPVVQLLNGVGLEVFDVEMFPTHGLSMRVYAGRRGYHNVSEHVPKLLAWEHGLRLREPSTYILFAKQIEERRIYITELLRELKRSKKRIAGYGAPAKGNTLLNYFQIGSGQLEYITEEMRSKIGLFTPGSHIPIVSINEGRQNPPDYYLLLAWNYRNVAFQKEEAFRSAGGRFIIPIGEQTIM